MSRIATSITLVVILFVFFFREFKYDEKCNWKEAFYSAFCLVGSMLLIVGLVLSIALFWQWVFNV